MTNFIGTGMSVARDTIFMGISNLFVVALGLLQYPILLRVYQFSPDSFGIFQYFLSVIMTISSFSYLAFDTSFVAERKEHNQWEKEQFISWFVLISNLLGALAWAIFSIGFRRMGILSFLYGILILTSQGVYDAYYTLARDTKYFKQIAIVSSLLSLYKVALVIPVGYFIRNESALVSAFVCANFLATYHIVYKLKVFPIKPDINFLGRFFAENKTIIIFETATRTLNTFSFNLPIFLLGKLFGVHLLGLYSLAYRTLLTANRIFSVVISQTFLPYMSKSCEDEIKIYTRYHYVPLLLFPIYFLTGALADFYVPILFGHQNIEIAGVIKILVPWMFASAVCTPTVSSYFVHKQNIELFILNIAFVLARALALLSFSGEDYRSPLLAFSGVSILFSVTFLIRAYKFAGVNCVRPLALILLMVVLMLGSIFTTGFLLAGYATALVSVIVASRFYLNILKSFLHVKNGSYHTQLEKNHQ